MPVVVQENAFCPKGKSDEISEYLPVGTLLYKAGELNVGELVAPPQPPVLLPDPPSHEESYSNNLTEALREIAQVKEELAEQKQLTDKWHQRACKDATERDALRNTLVALAPDLKVMAILYQQQGQSQRAQALMAIRESLGLEE